MSKKQSSIPVVPYWLAIGLTVSLVLTCFACAYFVLQDFLANPTIFSEPKLLLSENKRTLVLLIVGVVSGICIPAANRMQLKLRDKVEYDEFGQSRKHGDFSKLSKAERDRIEEAKMIDSERILPSTELAAMTHTGSKHPEEDLGKLTGLIQVKRMVNELAAQMAYDKKYKKKDSKEDHVYHMCFSGPPGTGKTTVARIMAGLLYKYGIIKTSKCVETDGNKFHGSTPAEATAKTMKLIHHAHGGILFIDEAYSLMADTGGTNREVIATLIKEMEDNRDGIVVILAGYENEMKSLIESNPGFKSRIQNFFNFEQYTIDDLKKIFCSMAKQEGYNVSEMAYDRFEELIEPMTRSKHFGNGRTVRNIVQASVSKHKINCMKIKDITSERISTLAYEDIDAPKTI